MTLWEDFSDPSGTSRGPAQAWSQSGVDRQELDWSCSCNINIEDLLTGYWLSSPPDCSPGVVLHVPGLPSPASSSLSVLASLAGTPLAPQCLRVSHQHCHVLPPSLHTSPPASPQSVVTMVTVITVITFWPHQQLVSRWGGRPAASSSEIAASQVRNSHGTRPRTRTWLGREDVWLWWLCVGVGEVGQRMGSSDLVTWCWAPVSADPRYQTCDPPPPHHHHHKERNLENFPLDQLLFLTYSVNLWYSLLLLDFTIFSSYIEWRGHKTESSLTFQMIPTSSRDPCIQILAGKSDKWDVSQEIKEINRFQLLLYWDIKYVFSFFHFKTFFLFITCIRVLLHMKRIK